MSAMRHRVVALCLDGLVAFDLTASAQAFGLAARPSGDPLYEFTTCSPGGAPVRTTSGFEVTPAAGLGALRRADTVVVPGYAGILAPPPEEALRALRAAHRRGARLLSVCTGAFALAHAGALDGRRATTHWAWAGSWRSGSRLSRSTPTRSSSTRATSSPRPGSAPASTSACT